MELDEANTAVECTIIFTDPFAWHCRQVENNGTCRFDQEGDTGEKNYLQVKGKG